MKAKNFFHQNIKTPKGFLLEAKSSSLAWGVLLEIVLPRYKIEASLPFQSLQVENPMKGHFHKKFVA